jgi:hypothetical protein
LPDAHALPVPQSVLVVHSFGVGGWEDGARQSPPWQTVPFAQSVSTEHPEMQPALVHVCPLGQLEEPVHAAGVAALTVEQPYPSHW